MKAPWLVAAALSVAAVWTPAASAAPAAKAATAKPYPHGSGSLSGLWRMTGYKGSTSPPRERVARDVNGNLPEMLPWARDLLEKRLVDAENGKLFPNTATQCLPEGVPYLMFAAVAGPVQILETPGQVTLISEEFNEIWFIYLNQKHPPVDDIEPTFHGDSVGHWEGDTLVVDTVALSTKTTLDQVGTPHSDALHVVSRIRRTDADSLAFLVTIDDPKTFTKPWDRRVVYKAAPAGERVHEYICDNNRNMPGADGFQSFQ